MWACIVSYIVVRACIIPCPSILKLFPPPTNLLPTVGDLCHYINSKLHRTEEAPMYIYANSELVVSKGSVIAEVYQEYREDDFFLYLGYYEENVYADIGRES